MSFFSRLPHRRGPRTGGKGTRAGRRETQQGSGNAGPRKVFVFHSMRGCWVTSRTHGQGLETAETQLSVRKRHSFFCRLPHWRGPRTGGKGTAERRRFSFMPWWVAGGERPIVGEKCPGQVASACPTSKDPGQVERGPKQAAGRPNKGQKKDARRQAGCRETQHGAGKRCTQTL